VRNLGCILVFSVEKTGQLKSASTCVSSEPCVVGTVRSDWIRVCIILHVRLCVRELANSLASFFRTVARHFARGAAHVQWQRTTSPKGEAHVGHCFCEPLCKDICCGIGLQLVVVWVELFLDEDFGLCFSEFISS